MVRSSMVRSTKWLRRCTSFGLAFGIIALLLHASGAPAAAGIALVTSNKQPGISGGGYVTVNLSPSTGTGNTVVVVASIQNTSALLPAPSQLTDSGGSLYTLRASQKNGTSSWIAIWSTEVGASIDSTWVKWTLNGTTSDTVISVASYSGVASLGQVVTGTTGASPASISVTIGDANNRVVAGFAGAGSAAPGPSSGTIEQSAVSNSTIGGALTDNWNATANTAVANAVTFSPAEAVAMAALELRTAAVPYNFDAKGSGLGGTVTVCQNFMSFQPRVGDTMVVVAAIPASGVNVTKVTDNATDALSSPYTFRAGTTNGSIRVEIWTGTVVSTATATIRVTIPSSSKMQCAGASYANVSAIGQTFTTTGTTANPTITPGWSIQEANNVVVGGFAAVSLGTATTILPTALAPSSLRAIGYCPASCGSNSSN